MEEMVIVSGVDSALDVAAMKANGTLQEWLETRNPKIELEVPGQTLTRFYLKPIPRSVFSSYVRRGSDPQDRYERAFACSVARIEHYPGAVGSLVPAGKVDAAGGAKVDMWTPADLERVADSFVQDIGTVAWWRSFLAHVTEPLFPVPSFLAQVIGYRLSRSAAESPTTPTTSSTEDSSVQ